MNQIEQKVGKQHTYPANLGLVPERVVDLSVVGDFQRVLALLVGFRDDQSQAIESTLDAALKTVAYGVGFRNYTTASGTGTGSFNSTDQLAVTGRAHRWDLLIETEAAEIRFLLEDGLTWGDAFPLPVGFYSIPFTSTVCQVRNRGASNCDYFMAAWW
jgi:hypothetical protein